MLLICKILRLLHQWMLSTKFDLNWPRDSGEEGFQISSINCRYFVIISAWKNAWPFILTNLNSLKPRMLCIKFGCNWPRRSEEEDF